MYCNIFPLGPRSRSRRSQLSTCPNRWGLSLNPWVILSKSSVGVFLLGPPTQKQKDIGIGYCGMEGDYSFIYDLEILNHSPGSVFFLYLEDWGVTW